MGRDPRPASELPSNRPLYLDVRASDRRRLDLAGEVRIDRSVQQVLAVVRAELEPRGFVLATHDAASVSAGAFDKLGKLDGQILAERQLLLRAEPTESRRRWGRSLSIVAGALLLQYPVIYGIGALPVPGSGWAASPAVEGFSLLVFFVGFGLGACALVTYGTNWGGAYFSSEVISVAVESVAPVSRSDDRIDWATIPLKLLVRSGAIVTSNVSTEYNNSRKILLVNPSNPVALDARRLVSALGASSPTGGSDALGRP